MKKTVEMWSSDTKTVCSSFLVLFYVASLTIFCDGKRDTQLCLEDSNASDELTFICSCPSVNDIMIIQDKKISYGNDQIIIPNNTKHWKIGECSAVHLSGPTLISLKNIYTLQLHHIDQIHIAYDFFLQYNTPLQMLHVSHSKFVAPEGSFNIHAHKIKNIVLDNIMWNGHFNLLILAQEDQYLDLIAIKRSTIEMLGEINISPKYVHTFVLEDNNIGTIFTGAILHDSHETNIQDNYIGHLDFLSMDTNAYNFTFQGNIVKFLSLESLVVNNATTIQVTNNSFFHIEKFALTWLRLRSKKGSMIFSGNQFHKHEQGSLIFYFTIYNEKLVIENNVLETTICNCSTRKLIENMTEANENMIPSFKGERDKAFRLFTESSFCRNEEGKLSSISSLCENNESFWSWELPAIITVIIITCGLLMIALVKQCMHDKKYKKLSTDIEIKTHTLQNLI